MPTDLTSNPLVLDAIDVGALPRTLLGAQQQSTVEGAYGGPSRTITQQMTIGQVTWHAAASGAGDMVVFTDLAGKEVIRLGPATGANFEDQRKGVDTLKVEGLILTVLPAGIVHVEYR